MDRHWTTEDERQLRAKEAYYRNIESIARSLEKLAATSAQSLRLNEQIAAHLNK